MGLNRWIKQKLRNWLLEDEEAKGSTSLEVLIDGKLEKVTAQGFAGLRLICTSRERPEQLTISAAQARDESKFWHIWRRFAGSLQWDDGTPCNPETDLPGNLKP